MSCVKSILFLVYISSQTGVSIWNNLYIFFNLYKQKRLGNCYFRQKSDSRSKTQFHCECQLFFPTSIASLFTPQKILPFFKSTYCLVENYLILSLTSMRELSIFQPKEYVQRKIEFGTTYV